MYQTHTHTHKWVVVHSLLNSPLIQSQTRYTHTIISEWSASTNINYIGARMAIINSCLSFYCCCKIKYMGREVDCWWCIVAVIINVISSLCVCVWLGKTFYNPLLMVYNNCRLIFYTCVCCVVFHIIYQTTQKGTEAIIWSKCVCVFYGETKEKLKTFYYLLYCYVHTQHTLTLSMMMMGYYMKKIYFNLWKGLEFPARDFLVVFFVYRVVEGQLIV